ncbi:hypothetical protein [Paramesorhizobium deserti]|uniref:hypothetical protein n=1 Tax=Paramesorhizobium deserti TaxID=1494590 RepID=UPI00128FDED8|nr:hypothetical protein [Paramesorhizobium deserti]
MRITVFATCGAGVVWVPEHPDIVAAVRQRPGALADPLSLSAEGMFLHPVVGGDLDESVQIQGHQIRFATVDLMQSASPILARLGALIEPAECALAA